MGGMHGLGPIAPETGEPVFHQVWESRMLAINIASPTRSNIDAGRHRRERIPGPDYLRMSYYEKWYAGAVEGLLSNGLVSPEELATGKAAPDALKATPRLSPDMVEAALSSRGSYFRQVGDIPLFRAGDSVRARNINPLGHTRLPRYARGRLGTVVRSHGAHVFPDSNAHGKGEDPRPLYTVRFSARDLWGETAEARDSVCLDLWEPYLERA
jgi:nitrile hydratase